MFYEMFKIMILDILGIKDAPPATARNMVDGVGNDVYEGAPGKADIPAHGLYPIVDSDGVYGSEIL